MSRTDDASRPSVPPSLLSLAERAKREHGDVLAHDTPAPASVSLPSSTGEILKRLAAHSERAQRYELRGEIARGGMGAVLDVWEEDLHRSLAMKVAIDVEPAPAGHVSDRGLPKLARFLEEAQVTAQLDHPGIVPVHELGLDDAGRLYFTMKRVAGRTLAQVFELVAEERDGWNQTRALSALLKACDAVSYAHKKGVIHRDLKPANVMVGSFGEVYVMDWGLARVVGREDRHDMRLRPQSEMLSSVHTDRRGVREDTPNSPLMTMDGAVLGTPAYMSPEQARNEVERLGPRSDVYAIGAMLYHLLSGQAPYLPRGSRVASYVVLRWLLEGPPQPLHEIRTDLPAELGAICEKAMSRDPDRRYADMRELADDLRAYLENRVVSAYETGSLAEMKKWIRRNKGVTSATAAGLLIAFGALAWVSIVESRARNEIEAKNELLQRSEALAQEAKQRAEVSAAVARSKTDEVVTWSALQEVQALIARADALWPAVPEHIAEYDEWLLDVRQLIDGHPASAAPELLPSRPSLADYRNKLAQARARALPRDESESPNDDVQVQARELEQKLAQRAWMQRMLGIEPWSSDDSWERDCPEPQNLTDMWRLVGPERLVAGMERCALEWIQLIAYDGATTPTLYAGKQVFAWALFRNGQLEDALFTQARALHMAPASEKAVFASMYQELFEAVAAWTTPAEREARAYELELLTREIDDLRGSMNARKTGRIATIDDEPWAEQLARLVAALERLAIELDSHAVTAEHGWGIRRRRQFAANIVERSIDGVSARAKWNAAIAAIRASPRYGGLVLTPQLGLLPLGEDRESGLWEFADLQTGEPPARGADGRWIVQRFTCIVFVLIPGGRFWMGAQNEDRTGRNYDPDANDPDEQPLRAVDLDAFFLSKYEMTQSQVERFTGQNPSRYCAQRGYLSFWSARRRLDTYTNPVEGMSWDDCQLVLSRLGMSLPTEAQWEYAARGGTETSWWTGVAKESLVGAVNLHDAYSRANGGNWDASPEMWLNDGNTVTAPVGSYRANSFGLHDVLGNVAEWCADAMNSYSVVPRAGDGLRSAREPTRYVNRGGTFMNNAFNCRASGRSAVPSSTESNNIGVRPARVIRP